MLHAGTVWRLFNCFGHILCTLAAKYVTGINLNSQAFCLFVLFYAQISYFFHLILFFCNWENMGTCMLQHKSLVWRMFCWGQPLYICPIPFRYHRGVEPPIIEGTPSFLYEREPKPRTAYIEWHFLWQPQSVHVSFKWIACNTISPGYCRDRV